MIARKNRGVNPRFFFLRGLLDALARVPVAPLGYRLRVAPGPRLPRRSLAYGRFAPGALGLSRKRAKRPRPHWGLGGLAAASRSAFAPRGALKRFGPAPPGVALRSTKGQGLRLRPASPPLPFFRFALPCLVLRLVRLCSLAALLGRVPPAGAQLSPLVFLAASLACALRASSRLSAAGLSLGRYRSRRSLCVFAAPPLFFCECFRCPFNHPPAPPILAGGARKLCAHFSPCDLICHCVHHRYTGVAMVH